MKTLSIQIKYNGIMTWYGIWNFLRTESDSLLGQFYQQLTIKCMIHTKTTMPEMTTLVDINFVIYITDIVKSYQFRIV